jgi:hypothetical protein
MRAMGWVLTNRVAPILDRKPHQPHDLIFGVTWWDSCRRNGVVPEFEPNVVSRAWTFGDYAANVMRDGLTDVNRNYASWRWQQLLHFSSLAQRRAVVGKQDTSLATLFARWDPPVRAAAAPEESPLLRKWRKDIDTGHECLFSPSENLALDEVLQFARDRGMTLTVVLFPLKPATMTDSGRQATLRPFAEGMKVRAGRKGFRLIDLTDQAILADDDFMADFDHVTPTGNLKFAHWALEHDLHFLFDEGRQMAATQAAAP